MVNSSKIEYLPFGGKTSGFSIAFVLWLHPRRSCRYVIGGRKILISSIPIYDVVELVENSSSFDVN